MHISKLPQGELLHKFNALSEASKERARQQILYITLRIHKKRKKEFRSFIKDNLHELINKSYLYKELINNYKLSKKLQENQAELDKYIIGNLCEFTSTGEYVTYSLF